MPLFAARKTFKTPFPSHLGEHDRQAASKGENKQKEFGDADVQKGAAILGSDSPVVSRLDANHNCG